MRLYIDKLQDTENYLINCMRDYLNLNCQLPINIKRNHCGKPYTDDYDINFSVSHSDEYIVVAISKSRIGVDIERIKDRDYIKVARRFFDHKEYKNIENIKDFYILWTLKEAYTKMLGVNLNTRITKDNINGEGYNIIHYDKPNGYIITVIYGDEE